MWLRLKVFWCICVEGVEGVGVRFLVEFLVGLGVVGCIRSWRIGRFWCG